MGTYDLYVTPEFVVRLRTLTAAAAKDATARRFLDEAQGVIDGLSRGTENGHHPLTDRTAKSHGDLRDCTASEFRSHSQAKLDSRIVWRHLPELRPGRGPVRELIHIGPRHETPDTYHHTIAALGRTPTGRVPENDVFGHVPYLGDKSMKVRTAALETQRARALAREGVAPMTTSRPLNETGFGARTGSTSGRQGRTLSQGRNK